jgi:hypothetical protein
LRVRIIEYGECESLAAGPLYRHGFGASHSPF